MPDLSAVLALSTLLSFGHGCPVTPGLALTARHVIDPRPLERDSPLLSVQWSARGRAGFATPFTPWGDRDVAVLMSDTNYPAFFPIASAAPEAGSPIYLVGFDWGSVKNALAEKPIKAKVLRIVAGQLLYDRGGEPGSSGSCVFNEAGEVVAINTGGFVLDNESKVGVGVGVWGLDLAALEKHIQEVRQ